MVRKEEKELERLHWELQEWKLQFHFMDDELLFIHRLMDSNAFNPNTPNLFEKLQNYKLRVNAFTRTKNKLRKLMSKHEHLLGGELEDADHLSEKFKQHELLKVKITNGIKEFQNLKIEIFNYTGSILLKHTT
ncbi:MAG: hypothetical protein WA810_00585 [Maribacter sp.]